MTIRINDVETGNPYRFLKGITYVVSMERFPEGMHEYDLRKKDEVLTELDSIIRREVPHIEDVSLSVDNMQYLTGRPCDIVTNDATTDVAWRFIVDEITQDVEGKWLDEAFERASVDFEEAERMDRIDIILKDVNTLIDNIEELDRHDIKAQLEAIERALLVVNDEMEPFDPFEDETFTLTEEGKAYVTGR